MAKASRSRDDDARALAASAAAPGAWAAPEPGASPGSSIVLTWDRSHGLHMIIPTPAKQDSFALSSSRPVLRVFPPYALVSHAQGSSGVVATMLFV